MFFGFVAGENMDDLVPGGFQVIGNQRAMALPPEGFGAHDGRAFLPRVLQQTFDARAEFFRHHKIRVTAKRRISPGRVG